MADDLQRQRASYPLSTWNFRVVVDGAAMRFAKVSGLHREHQTQTYRHGLSFREGELITKFRVDAYGSVTLEQGTVVGSRALQDWLERRTPVSMDISLCDDTGTPVLTWSIARALPVKLTAATFDAASNEASIDVLEVKAAGVSMHHLV